MDFNEAHLHDANLLDKYPAFLTLTSWISIKHACIGRPSTFMRMREFFAACRQRQRPMSDALFSAVGYSL